MGSNLRLFGMKPKPLYLGVLLPIADLLSKEW